MIDYYYEQLNFTERRIYKSIYVSIVNKESYVYIAHIKKAQRQAGFLRYPPLGLVIVSIKNQTFLRNMP